VTPTGRSLVYLRRLGFTAAVVERWLPRVQLRQDLFGVADVLAFHPRDRLFLLVQVTTAGHVAHRLAKAKGRPELAAWLRAGGRVEIHGWQQRAGRWPRRADRRRYCRPAGLWCQRPALAAARRQPRRADL
jgi:hypothetical protein